MAKKNLESELLDKTGVKLNKKADRQEQLQSIAEAARGLEDTEWDKLSPAAQEWTNKAVSAMNDETEIPDFTAKAKPAAEDEDDEAGDDDAGDDEADAEGDGDDEAADDESDEDDDGEEQEKSVAKSTSKKKAAKKAVAPKKAAKKAAPAKKAAKKAADKPAKKAAAPRALDGDGVKVRIKREIMKNPKVSVDDLVTKLGKGSASRLTVASIRSEFRHSLRVLSQDGHLKKAVEL